MDFYVHINELIKIQFFSSCGYFTLWLMKLNFLYYLHQLEMIPLGILPKPHDLVDDKLYLNDTIMENSFKA